MSRWKCRTQYIAKNSPSGDHRTTLSGHIFASDACIDNRKKILNSNVFFTCFPTLRPTSGWDRFVILGHPSKFQRVSHFGFVLQRRRWKEANQTLRDVWPSPGLVHYIYTFGGSCPVTEFCHVQHSLCVQVLRSLAALLHGTLVVCVSQTLRRWTEGAIYIRQGGHHVGHWPTF